MIDRPTGAVQTTGLPPATDHAIMERMTNRRSRCLALLALLPAAVCAAQAATGPASAPTPAPTGETLDYRTSEGDGTVLGTAHVELTRTDGRSALVEKRHAVARGRDELYRVSFDSATLAPLAWYRRSSNGKQVTETALERRGDQFEIRSQQPDEEARRATLAVPPAPFVVEPLIKFYLAAAIDRGERSGLFRAVVANEQLTDAVELRFTDLGTENITVGAGSFACHHLRVEPTSALYAAIMPAGEMYFGTGGGHPFVLGTGKAHRMAGTTRTELVSYRAR